ncbi:MAG TPA: N-acetylmuramoyl-L-alanine amidase [Nitrospiraceae bacterium]|jgi:N-acetylmuramoyl-L-alanine amidase|nr:N-acetylmuramoyl-L-alanine amidase [Nitrospiraceae bacterium]
MSRVKKCSLIFIALVLLWVPISPVVHLSEATDKAEVKNIQYWSSQGYTRVVVELSRPVQFTNKRLSNPDRLYFDLKNTKITKEIKTKLSVGDGILKLVRAGQFDPQTVRIVLDLETMEDFSAYILDDPTKLVIDVNAKKQKQEKQVVTSRKILVLDPGHGGHDSGAVGPGGLQEKDVVLDIALRVKEILSTEPGIEVILTREKDVFIPLPERTLTALQANADLFVSIHANASPNRAARGIETYLQNWTNEEEAIRVAARENYLSVKRMKQQMAQYKNDDVGKMLSDLRRDFKRDESVALAHYVQDALVTDVAKVHKKVVNLGVKQAMFFVLMGASMPPSILAEVSFISNPEEEQLLSRESYRSRIAASIASGIKTYLTASPSVQQVAYSRKRQ